MPASFLIWCIFFSASATEPSPWVRAPYVQNVTKTAFSLLWETAQSQNCTASIRSPDENTWELVSGPAAEHEVRFEGLAPSIRYNYEIRCTDGIFRGFTRTAPPPSEPFTFLVYGDTRHGHMMHRALVQVLAFESMSFVLHTGDFVDDGMRRVNWIRFFDIAHPFMRRVPLYPTVGNHENAFGAGADLFRRFFAVPDDGPYSEMVYAFTWGNSRFFILDSNKPFTGSPQAAWLRAQLQEASLDRSIRHLFVSVHQSPYSSGPHGPLDELVDSGLVDEMRRFGVDLLFAGHDHMYERGRVDGLNYVITAGGGAPIYYVKQNHPYSLVTEPTYHYTRIHVDGDRVELAALRMDGSLLDSVHLRRRSENASRPQVEVVSEKRPEPSLSETRPTPSPIPPEPVAARPPSPRNRNWAHWGLAVLLAALAAGGIALHVRRRKSGSKQNSETQNE